MKPTRRINFREIHNASRREAAESAWHRAKQASGLRRLLVSQRRFAGAGRCSAMKAEALKLVTDLMPDQVRVTIDDDYQVGLVSVRWVGHGRFHLPAGSDLEQVPRSRVRSA